MPESDTREQKVAGLTIRIHRDLCIGSGNCAKVAPQVFTLDDEQIADFRQPPQHADPDDVVEACTVCPVDALIALDKDGNRLAP